MLIQPDTYIRLIKNCPLDKTYDHTIYFESPEEQVEYFKVMLKGIPFNKQSYQRYDKGVLHIQAKAEDLYACNYLMFQNSAFGDKYFYAFITSIEYVNNVSSRIRYELDVMQTWFFDYNLEPCFVEREHSATDELFENLVPENLDLGDDYVCNGTDVFDMNEMNICILSSQGALGYQTTGKCINNIYTPLRITSGVPVTDTTSVDDLINEYEGKEDGIIAIYQYPAFLGDSDTTEPKIKIKEISKNILAIDGYLPKNKKLFTYPYNFLLVSNNAGNVAEYKWENFISGNTAQFKIAGVFVSTPSVMCYPVEYRGIADDYDSGLTLNSFPQCPWVGDVFKMWWARNKASATTSLAEGVATLIASIGPDKSTTQAVKSAFGVAGSLAKMHDLKNVPPQVYGQAQTESLNAGIGRVEFTFYKMSIKKQFVKIIDSYFERYGYATHLNKIPNRNVRPHWTFTKTNGCTITPSLTGSVPADDAVAITRIYDNGITFWRNGGEIGNYILDNKPVKEE